MAVSGKDTRKQEATAMIESLLKQSREMFQLSGWTLVSGYSFSYHALERNIAVREPDDDGSRFIPYTMTVIQPVAAIVHSCSVGKARRLARVLMRREGPNPAGRLP